jgi:glycosyltransferase involved in cell wall biosynthesis
MKILIISPFFPPDVGGVETMLAKFCEYLTKRKWRTVVLTYNPLIASAKAPSRENWSEHVSVRRIRWIGHGLFNIFERYAAIQFLYLVPALTVSTIFFLLFSKKKPEVIHAFGLSAAFAGGMASRIYKIPCVVDMCTVYRLPERPVLARLVKRLLKNVDYIRGNSLPGKDELIGIGIDPKKIGLITPPVDESVFKAIDQSTTRKKVGLTPGKFIALFVGRMVESKNVDIALAATSLVKSPNVSFVFVGEGPLRMKVDEAAKKDRRIVAVNSVKHHDLVYYYNSGDILLCAAVDKDLISFVGREALMCGLPILALNQATYAGISYKVDKSLVPDNIGCILDSNPKAIAAYLDKIISRYNEKHTLPFKRSDCVEYGLNNFSQRAMDWLGDSYQVARKNHFAGKNIKS